jgi:hypothetical protein
VQPPAVQLTANKKQLPSKVQGELAQLEKADNQSIVFVQQPAAQLPWGHHQLLLDKINDHTKRLFYLQKCVENSWSRNILAGQIESNLYSRQGKAISNFNSTLPAMDSDLVRETFKNPVDSWLKSSFLFAPFAMLSRTW